MAVDTLTLSRELKAAEGPPVQAEAIASATGRAIIEGDATKSDLLQLGARFDGKFDQLRVTMMTWLITSTLTVVALIVAALKL